MKTVGEEYKEHWNNHPFFCVWCALQYLGLFVLISMLADLFHA